MYPSSFRSGCYWTIYGGTALLTPTTRATRSCVTPPHIHLTGEEHGGLKAQLLHFLGKQGVHFPLQGAHGSLAVVEDGARRQHGRRLQAAQAADAVAAAAVAKQQEPVGQPRANCPVAWRRWRRRQPVLAKEGGPAVGRGVRRRADGVGGASPGDRKSVV